MEVVIFVIISSKNSWSVGVGDKYISVDFVCVCCVCERVTPSCVGDT